MSRMTPIIFAIVPTIVGSAMLVGLKSTPSHKGALLLGTSACYLLRVKALTGRAAIYLSGTFGSALSTVYAYNASNTSGHTKKACLFFWNHTTQLLTSMLQNTINAMTLVAFGVGNIIGTEIFQPKDAPAYIPGKTAILVLLSVQLFICYLIKYLNVRLNKQRKTRLEEEKARRGWSDEDVQKERERHAFLDLTDKQ